MSGEAQRGWVVCCGRCVRYVCRRYDGTFCASLEKSKPRAAWVFCACVIGGRSWTGAFGMPCSISLAGLYLL